MDRVGVGAVARSCFAGADVGRSVPVSGGRASVSRVVAADGFSWVVGGLVPVVPDPCDGFAAYGFSGLGGVGSDARSVFATLAACGAAPRDR